MNFSNRLDHFKTTMSKVLDLEQPIQEHDVKKVSSILKTFANCDMNKSEVKMFLDSVLIYFVFLNKYAKQFEIRSKQKHFHVRLALEVFLFVVDKQQIHNIIINKFAKVIDTILESDPLNSNVKEYIRIYSDILDNISRDVAQKVAAKHKKIYIWHEVVKKTGDIETQAIIITVLFKIFKFHDFNVILENTFPEITQMSITNEKSMYQNIRMILDKINESGTNIFSINCSTIEVDSLRVEEFNKAAPSDIWLDFNLLEESISFFCSQHFFASLTSLKPFLQTSWEVLSFYTRDVLKVDFSYNPTLKTLELSLKLRGSVFNLLCSPKFDTVCSVDISVSQYSERFNVLVEKILPKFFPNVFFVDCPILLSDKDTDTSVTPDISLKSRSSSPVIDCFTMNRPKISTVKEADLQNGLQECELQSIVSISDDEDDIMVNEDSKNKSRICAKINDEEIQDSKSKKHINAMTDTTKYSSHERSAQFNKSITPVSFTESVVKRTKMSRRESFAKEKKKRGQKISTSLSSPIVNVKSKVSKKGKRKLKDLIEVAREAHLEDILETSEVYSVTKVEDWLKSVDNDNVPIGENEREILEIPAFEEKIDSDPVEVLPVSGSDDISDKTLKVDMQMLILHQEQIPKTLEENESPNRSNELKIQEAKSTAIKNYEEEILKSPAESTRINGAKIQEEKTTAIKENHEEIQKSPPEITRLNGAKIQEEKSTEIKENNEEVTRITEEKSLEEKEVDVSKGSSGRNYQSVIQEVEENLSKIFSDHEDEAEIQAGNQDSETQKTDDLLNILSSQKEKTPEICDKADFKCSISLSDISLKDSVFDKLKDLEPNNNIVKKSRRKYNISSSSDEEAIVEETPKENNQNVNDIKQDRNIVKKTRRKYNIGSSSDEEAIVEEKPKENNQNVSDIKQDLNETIQKRKLYSPGDLSYLKAQMTEEYLTSKGEVKPPPQPTLITPSTSKRPRTKKKKGAEPKKRRYTKVTSTPKKPVITKEDIMKIKVVQPDKISKMLDSLKEERREEKKNRKAVKSLNKRKKAVQATSSSESIEPFGECLKMCRKRTSSPSTHTDTKHYKSSPKKEKKIHIISNILIQPASDQKVPSTADISNCYEQLVVSQGESFLKCVKNVQKCEPQLLQNEVFEKIFKELRSVHESK